MKLKQTSKKLGKAAVGLLIAALAFSGCTNKKNASVKETETETSNIKDSGLEEGEGISSRIQDDFYEAVNGEWIRSTEIPADKSLIGGFGDLSYNVEDILISDLDNMLLEGKDELGDEMGSMLAYYKMALDMDRRNEEGAAPIKGMLEEIYSISGLEQFNRNTADYTLSGWEVPLKAYVMADMQDAVNNTIYLGSPTLGLSDKSYYEEDNAAGQQLIPVYERMLADLFLLTGESEEDSLKMAKETVAFEKIIALYSKSAQEASVMKDMYHPVAIDQFAELSNNVDLKGYVTNLLGKTPEQVIVTDLNYFENLDAIVNEETFPMMKSYMAAQLLNASSTYLSKDFRITGSAIQMLMSGQTEISDDKRSAFRNATLLYSQVLGDYYGKKYFGIDAKEDVTQMVENMIQVYKERLNNNAWLSSETKEKAVKKLDTMTVKVGYPDRIPEVYSKIKVTDYDNGGSFFSNMIDAVRINIRDNFDAYAQPVDKSLWNISADTVDARYSFTDNSICFPAAILQAPFYELNQSPSKNYGGIGAVIAHEITHAFDNNGSQYDEYGNLNDWWTEEDYKKFEEKTNLMVELFDGAEHAGGAVDGLLTVTENVADAGGISCALEVVKGLPGSSLEDFFKSYAAIWRMKATPEYEQLLLILDVHAPGKLRTNLQVSNFEEFYTTFDVTEEDEMYLSPEQRVKIW